MIPWRRFGAMAFVLFLVWGCGQNNSLRSPVADDKGQPPTEMKPEPKRFTKASNGVITDSVTALEWYVGPNPDNSWHQAKAWTENLTVAGGGWRLPTLAELKGLYQYGVGPNHMDPVFQTTGAWAWSGQVHNAWSAWGLAFYNNLEGWHALDYAYGRMALAVRSRK